MSSLLSTTALCGMLILTSLILPSTLGEEDECVFALTNVPYITFNGKRLPDHSYFDIRQLGDAENGSNVLQCHTDLVTCCGNTEDAEDVQHTGEWVLPSGLIVEPTESRFSVRALSQRIDLVYSGPGDSLTPQDAGIYQCRVPTIAVNDVGDTARESVYIGLYKADNMYIQDMFLTADSDLNGDYLQFTITCVSVGGPVGCVVWRRHKEVISNPVTTSTVIDPAQGLYEHILIVTERLGGAYSCSVANDKPASEYEGIFVEYAEDPLYAIVIPQGPTSIQVIWDTPQPVKKVIGFRIYYDGPTRGSVDVDDATANNYLLTGLKNNATYTVSIAGKSNFLPSQRIQANPVKLVPGTPELQLYSATSDSVSLSWTLPTGSLVDGFEIKWDRVDSQLATFRDTLSPKQTNYTVTGLQGFENAVFSISVTASNAVGTSTSSNMNIVGNFVSGSGSSTSSSDSSSNDNDETVIIGVVVAILVVLAIVVVIISVMIYHYKSKSNKKNANSRSAVYSLAGPVSGSVSPTAPIPPPRPDIQIFNNGSYTPNSNPPPSTEPGYYRPTSYIYPNPSSTNQTARNTAVANGNTTTSDNEANGHGYEYITVQK